MTTGYKNPPRRPATEFHVTPRNAISRRLAALYRTGMTWRAIGAKFGISGGMAFRVAVEGYMPHDARVRAVLRHETYEDWKARNADRIAAIVAWAETPREQRQKWSKR